MLISKVDKALFAKIQASVDKLDVALVEGVVDDGLVLVHHHAAS